MKFFSNQCGGGGRYFNFKVVNLFEERSYLSAAVQIAKKGLSVLEEQDKNMVRNSAVQGH